MKEVVYTWHFRDALVGGTYMAIICEVDTAFGCLAAYVCKNIGSTYPFHIMAVWLTFTMWKPYLFSDIYQIIVWLLVTKVLIYMHKTYMHGCNCTYVHACIHIGACLSTYIHTNKHVCIYAIHIQMLMHVWLHTYIQTCAYLTYSQYTHACLPIYIHVCLKWYIVSEFCISWIFIFPYFDISGITEIGILCTTEIWKLWNLGNSGITEFLEVQKYWKY